MREVIGVERLVGRTIVSISGDLAENVIFNLDDGKAITFYHDQDCCEFVRLHEVVGDPALFAGKVVASASEDVHDNETPEGMTPPSDADSYTWTIFDISTTDGQSLRLVWLGTSNGYYGEGVYVSENDA
jgi:hypothetical protein